MHSARKVPAAAQSGRLPFGDLRGTGAAHRSVVVANFDRKITRTTLVASVHEPFRLSDHLPKPIQNDALYAFIAGLGERMRGWVRAARERASSRASHGSSLRGEGDELTLVFVTTLAGMPKDILLNSRQGALNSSFLLLTYLERVFLHPGAHSSTRLESMILRSRVRTGRPCALAVATIARSAGSR